MLGTMKKIYIIFMFILCMSWQSNYAMQDTDTDDICIPTPHDIELCISIKRQPSDINNVKNILTRYKNPNARDALGRTALYHALNLQQQTDRIALARLLIQHGANIRKRTGYITPLHQALVSGLDDLALEMIDNSDVNAQLANGLSPLHLAIMTRKFNLASRLIARGADVNAIADGYTPLAFARIRQSPEIVNFLLSKITPAPLPPVSDNSWHQHEPIEAQTSVPNPRIAQLPVIRSAPSSAPIPATTTSESEETEIEQSIETNQENKNDPAFLAVWYDKHIKLKHLIAQGIPLTYRNENGETLLHICWSGAIAQILLENGVDPHAKATKGPHRGKTALALAQQYNQMDKVTAIGLHIEKNTPKNNISSNSRNSFFDAMLQGNSSEAAALLRQGGISMLDRCDRRSAIFTAIREDRLPVLEELLRQGISLASQSSAWGQSLLHLCTSGQTAEFLLTQAHIDPHVKISRGSDEGKTALEVALLKGQTDKAAAISRFLEQCSDTRPPAIPNTAASISPASPQNPDPTMEKFLHEIEQATRNNNVASPLPTAQARPPETSPATKRSLLRSSNDGGLVQASDRLLNNFWESPERPAPPSPLYFDPPPLTNEADSLY